MEINIADALRQAASQIERSHKMSRERTQALRDLCEWPAEPADDKKQVQAAVAAMAEGLYGVIRNSNRGREDMDIPAELLIAGIATGVLLVQEAGLDWTNAMFIQDEDNLQNLQYVANVIRVGDEVADRVQKTAEKVYDAQQKEAVQA